MIFSVDCASFKGFESFPSKETIFLDEELEVSIEAFEFKENLEDGDLLLTSSLSLFESAESEEKFFFSFNSFSLYNLKIELILLKAELKSSKEKKVSYFLYAFRSLYFPRLKLFV